MRTKLFIYFWIGLTVAMVAIPCGMLVVYLRKKASNYINKKAQLIKENAEIKHMKSELEQQKEEFITTGEYGPFVSQEERLQEEIQQQENPIKESASESVFSDLLKEAEEKERAQEKERKRLDALLLEADLLKNEGKFEAYEKKLIEAMAIDDEAIKVLKPLSDLYFTL